MAQANSQEHAKQTGTKSAVVADGSVDMKREEARTSLILLLLRVALMAAAAIAIAWPLTTTVGWLGCGVGAAVGVFVGSRLGRSRLRHWLIVVGIGISALMCAIMSEQLVAWDWVVSLFGGRGALELAEVALWGGGAFLLLTLLRSSAHRYPSLGVLELVLPLLAAASLFSAHRDGNIHRPQQLVDFALERGQDPTWYLQLLGVLGALFLALGLLRLRRGVQIFGGIALIALLVMGMLVVSTNVPKSTLLSMQKRFGKTGKEKSQVPTIGQSKNGKKRKPRNRKGPKSNQPKDKRNPNAKQPPKKRKPSTKQPPKKRPDQPRKDDPKKGKQKKGKPKPVQLKKKQGKRDPKNKKKYMRFRSQKPRSQRNRLVGIVLFKNDYTPPSKIYYFRQRAMSQYNGIRMVSAARGDVDLDRVDHFPILNTLLKVSPPVKLPAGVKGLQPSAKTKRKVALPKPRPRPTKGPPSLNKEREALRKLLKMLKAEQDQKGQQMKLVEVKTIVSLMHDHSNPFGLATSLSYRGLPNPAPRVFLRSYMVRSLAWIGRLYPRFRIRDVKQLPALLRRDFPMRKHEVGESWWPETVTKYYTKPPDDPRYRELLKKILAPLQDDPGLMKQKMAKAFAIKRWLEHNAQYSMRQKPPAGVRDHVAHFLFVRRIGYCVHFSHAAVYLLRMIGVPARVAEGYAVPARERGSGSSLLIKAGAAHAWPEIYLRGLGWVPFDIYPKKNLDAQRPRPPDPKRRQMLANMARPKKIPPLKKTRSAKDKSKRESRVLKVLGAIARFPWWWIPTILLVLLFLLKWWRRYAYLWTPSARRLPIFYRSFEDRLSELGVRREAGETLESFAESMRDGMPALHDLLSRLSAARLGSRMVSPTEEPAQIKALMKQFRGFFPWYRRLWRFFDPVSWSMHLLHRWRYLPPDWWVAWLTRWEQINERLNRVLFIFRRAR